MKILHLTAEYKGITYHVNVLSGCWWLWPGVYGMTISKSWMLIRYDPPNVSTMAHELVHIMQYRRYKFFLLRYIWEFIRHGKLTNNQYELEAYNNEHDVFDNATMVLT